MKVPLPGSDVMNVPEGWYLITDSKDGANFKTALVASTVQGQNEVHNRTNR